MPVLRSLWVRYGRVFSSFSAIQAMQMALPLLALPWLARVLGPDAFGLLMYSCLAPPLAALFMDWGLGTGGARAIALARNDPGKIAAILGGFFSAKIILFGACAAIGPLVWFCLPADLISAGPYALALGAGAARSMSPVWFFQGAGYGMPCMAAWDVGASVAALGLIILLIRSPEQWSLYLAILLLTKALAYGCLLAKLWLRYLPSVSFAKGINTIKATAPLFGGPFALMICYNGSQLVLGFFLTAAEAGILGAASKILRALGSLVNPFASTLLPELCILSRSNGPASLRIFKWSLGLAFFGGLVLCCLVWLLAPLLIEIALGKGYRQVPHVLCLLALALPFMACNSIITSQGLIPFGREGEQSRIQGLCALFCLPMAALFGFIWGLDGGAVMAPLMEGSAMIFLLAAALKSFREHGGRGRPAEDSQANKSLSQ